MLLLICLHYLHFSRAGLCMLPIGFSLAAAMCTQGSSAWLTTKISCIFRTTYQNNFKFSVQLGQILYFCVAQFVNLTGVQKKFPRWVCGGIVHFDTGGHLPLWSFAQVRSAAISRNLHSLCVDLLALQKPFV